MRFRWQDGQTCLNTYRGNTVVRTFSNFVFNQRLLFNFSFKFIKKLRNYLVFLRLIGWWTIFPHRMYKIIFHTWHTPVVSSKIQVIFSLKWPKGYNSKLNLRSLCLSIRIITYIVKLIDITVYFMYNHYNEFIKYVENATDNW